MKDFSSRAIVSLDNEDILVSGIRSGDYTSIFLPPEESHHIKNVLRLKEGAHLEVISKASGIVFQAIIQSLGKECEIRLINIKRTERLSSKLHHLLFGLCKGDTNDWVIEKCVELAVPNLTIWQADHSVAKIKTAEDIEKKVSRWQKIAESACKQSGNSTLTKISYAGSLQEALTSSRLSETEKIVCSLSTHTISLNSLKLTSEKLLALVGPEGDFSKQENELIEKHNFQHITLGPNTLRAETAAISIAAGINAVFGYSQAD